MWLTSSSENVTFKVVVSLCRSNFMLPRALKPYKLFQFKLRDGWETRGHTILHQEKPLTILVSKLCLAMKTHN